MLVNLSNVIYDYIDKYECVVFEFESQDFGSVYLLIDRFFCFYQGFNGCIFDC